MSKVNTKITCPGCKIGKVELSFKKPALFCPTIASFDCPDCKSGVFVKIRKLPGTPAQQVNIQAHINRPSQFLKELLTEEALHNAQPVEPITPSD